MIENVKIGHGFVHVTVHRCIFHLHASIDTWRAQPRANTLLAIVRILINIRGVLFSFFFFLNGDEKWHIYGTLVH